jgi:hypothetical protein
MGSGIAVHPRKRKKSVKKLREAEAAAEKTVVGRLIKFFDSIVKDRDYEAFIRGEESSKLKKQKIFAPAERKLLTVVVAKYRIAENKFNEGVITEEEFSRVRQSIVDELGSTNIRDLSDKVKDCIAQKNNKSEEKQNG